MRSGPFAEVAELPDPTSHVQIHPPRDVGALEADGSSLVIPPCPYGTVWGSAYSPVLGQLGRGVIRSSRTFVSLRSTQHRLCQNSCAFGIILIGFRMVIPNRKVC